MDSFIEKKWFVYLGDHHEGPFSLIEIQEKMVQGVVTSEGYVWAEGMKDWKPMKEVPDFASLLLPSQSEPAFAHAPTLAITDSQTQSELPYSADLSVGLGHDETPTSPTQENMSFLEMDKPEASLSSIEPQAPFHSLVEKSSSSQIISHPLKQESPDSVPHLMAKSVAEEKTGDLDPSDLQKVKTVGVGASHSIPKNKKKFQVSSGLVISLVLLSLVTGSGVAYQQGVLDSFFKSPLLQDGFKRFSAFLRPYILRMIDQYPTVGAWISPLPNLNDVTPDEYDALKFAAIEAPGKTGPRIAIALSKADPLSPIFYVSSNLPDGVKFQIWVTGVSDTLLNHLSFNTQVEVTLNQRLGISNSIRFTDGKPVPKGEYLIYLTPSQNQAPEIQALLANSPPVPQKLSNDLPKDIKILAFKTYFLGGVRDAAYTARLKEYHDKLRLKASEEIKEVSQFLNTLESQLNSSTTKFAFIKKAKMNAKQRQAWESFHTEWMKFQGQLDLIFQKWTPESIHNDYFYETLYLMTQQVGQSVVKVHEMHHAFLNGGVDPKTFEIQIGEASSTAQTAISQLRSKISQALALPLSPNGMPNREGL